MIAALRGTLVSKMPTRALVQVGGVTMEVLISVSCFETLPAAGKEVSLLTHLHVREDALQLYGFADEVERAMFQHLVSVTGIGPRVAVGILSGATASRVREAVESGDVDFLLTLPGVGRKLAQRILVELREKLAPGVAGAALSPPGAGTPGALSQGRAGDATAALLSLGYTRAAAQAAVQAAAKELGSDASVEALVRKALQQGVR
ncbi:MAG TPA: Holliday junction branch migration protein RuvA [Candidatus Eisenbacteria bacterium]|jgi:Holliday junction DNA helicase RuvA